MAAIPFDLDQFDAAGYACVADVFDDADLAPVFEEYGELLDRLARQWCASGRLASTYADLAFEERFLRVTQEAGAGWSQHFDCSLPQSGVTRNTPIHLGKAIFELIRHERLLDLVEQYVGGEIYSTPIQHIRIKPPQSMLTAAQRDGLTVTSPWHQDQGVALPDADHARVLTVWVALTDATEENGCLCVAPGSHRRGLVSHCPNRGMLGTALEIPPSLQAQETIPLPVRRGTVILMHHHTMHASLANRSAGVRWSLDLRFQPTGSPLGRPAFPGFVARSRRNPASELTDVNTWQRSWLAVRERLAENDMPSFHRWAEGSSVCA